MVALGLAMGMTDTGRKEILSAEMELKADIRKLTARHKNDWAAYKEVIFAELPADATESDKQAALLKHQNQVVESSLAGEIPKLETVENDKICARLLFVKRIIPLFAEGVIRRTAKSVDAEGKPINGLKDRKQYDVSIHMTEKESKMVDQWREKLVQSV